jgi:hypothetical protein
MMNEAQEFNTQERVLVSTPDFPPPPGCDAFHEVKPFKTLETDPSQPLANTTGILVDGCIVEVNQQVSFVGRETFFQCDAVDRVPMTFANLIPRVWRDNDHHFGHRFDSDELIQIELKLDRLLAASFLQAKARLDCSEPA